MTSKQKKDSILCSKNITMKSFQRFFFILLPLLTSCSFRGNMTETQISTVQQADGSTHTYQETTIAEAESYYIGCFVSLSGKVTFVHEEDYYLTAFIQDGVDAIMVVATMSTNGYANLKVGNSVTINGLYKRYILTGDLNNADCLEVDGFRGDEITLADEDIATDKIVVDEMDDFYNYHYAYIYIEDLIITSYLSTANTFSLTLANSYVSFSLVSDVSVDIASLETEFKENFAVYDRVNFAGINYSFSNNSDIEIIIFDLHCIEKL